ncbi:hypothetical protein [Pantoea sp. PGP6]
MTFLPRLNAAEQNTVLRHATPRHATPRRFCFIADQPGSRAASCPQRQL